MRQAEATMTDFHAMEGVNELASLMYLPTVPTTYTYLTVLPTTYLDYLPTYLPRYLTNRASPLANGISWLSRLEAAVSGRVDELDRPNPPGYSLCCWPATSVVARIRYLDALSSFPRDGPYLLFPPSCTTQRQQHLDVDILAGPAVAAHQSHEVGFRHAVGRFSSHSSSAVTGIGTQGSKSSQVGHPPFGPASECAKGETDPRPNPDPDQTFQCSFPSPRPRPVAKPKDRRLFYTRRRFVCFLPRPAPIHFLASRTPEDHPALWGYLSILNPTPKAYPTNRVQPFPSAKTASAEDRQLTRR